MCGRGGRFIPTARPGPEKACAPRRIMGRSVMDVEMLMGAALETGFLSLVQLVRLLHAKLPAGHDPLWDELVKHADSIAHTASTGVSIGMSYHLLVDGLVQPAAYHGLPVSMPIEAHQTMLVANAAAEAVDVKFKPVPARVTSPAVLFARAIGG